MFLALVLLFTTNQTVLAVNVNSNDSTSIQQLYILSKQCPEQYIDYAKEIVGDILAGYNLSNASLGRPFTFSSQKSDIYYFPIYSNHKIVSGVNCFNFPCLFRFHWRAYRCGITVSCRGLK